MKKLIINICDSTIEKFRLESINQKKSIQDLLKEIITSYPFSDDVKIAYDDWIQKSLQENIFQD